ncbi:MAG: electron transfer flavoprotein subunit alpha/FixB family protein [Bacillota bacterium]|nr:electron transfer flavoprotein subunit alpha/FixB family protein [Bacillota bacterium]
MIFSDREDATRQLLCKAMALFYSEEKTPEFIVVEPKGALEVEDSVIIDCLQELVTRETPEVLLIGATALGEELAPALGIRLETGVAAHCIDIKFNPQDRLTFMVPAFGGKVIGEIFVPEARSGRPAIGTIKPGTFREGNISEEVRRIELNLREASAKAVEPRFEIKNRTQIQTSAGDIQKADIVFCAGFGCGDEETKKKLEELADRLGAKVGCTRAALDAGRGYEEETMIGTSGVNIRPKLYIGFGISGAAHHTCGIKDADIIVSINKDRNAEIFRASDYIGIFDADQVIDQLIALTE